MRKSGFLKIYDQQRKEARKQEAMRQDFLDALTLIRRCRDSAGRMEMGLYEDLQNFLHKHS